MMRAARNTVPLITAIAGTTRLMAPERKDNIDVQRIHGIVGAHRAG